MSFSGIAAPRTGVRGGGASRDEVLDGRGVRTIVGEMLRGVALPAQGRTRYIGGICVVHMDSPPGVEANAGFRSLRKCKIGLSGVSLTNVVVKWQAGQKGEKRELFTALGSCLASWSDALHFCIG